MGEGDEHLLPVAVVERVPSYRRGLTAALRDAGFAPVEPADVRAFVLAPGRRAVVITLMEREDRHAFTAIAAASGDVVVVALVPKPTIDDYRSLIVTGAGGVAPWDASPEDIVDVVRAALSGTVMLPATVAKRLAENVLLEPGDGAVTTEELAWLQMLSRGELVRRVASAAGYSERAMYRLLQRLYGRLGASNRSEAIAEAARRGLLGRTNGRG